MSTEVWPYFVVTEPGGSRVHRLEGTWASGIATLCGHSFRQARLSLSMPPGIDSCSACVARLLRERS